MRSLSTLVCWICLSSAPIVVFAKQQQRQHDNNDNPFAALHERYQDLSPKGKAVAGATAGFVGSRLALSTVTRVVKYGAAAYIAAEVLRMTGVMDDIPALSAEQSNMVHKFKGMVLQTADDFRINVRRNLNRERVQSFFEQERSAAFGFAGGAIAGVVL